MKGEGTKISGLSEVTRRAFIGKALAGIGSSAALAGALASCGSSTGSAGTSGQGSQKLERVTLQLNFNPNAEHAPYYLGKSKGYFSSHGIDLTILPGTGSAAAAKLVGAGHANFGHAVADAVTVSRGQGIPLVSIGVLLQHSPTVLGSLKTSNITRPTDLYGKKFADDTASTTHAFWQAFSQLNHLDLSKITVVNVSASIIAPIIARTVDAGGMLLTNEVVVIEQQGHPLNIINYADYGVKSYGQTLFTTETLLNGKPGLAKKMAQATFQSWKYSMNHVSEAIDALAAAVPETDKTLETAKWPNIKKLMRSPDEQANGLGHQTLAGWTQTYNTFKTGGEIGQAFDPKAIFRNIAFEQG